jgi:uncharacterized protein (TIGR03000 family)
MYSVVLLAALTGGVETPDCHKAACSGCTGYVSTGCSGYSSCSGSCHGGRLFGGGLFNHKHSCSGSCSGSYVACTGYTGCTGSYMGCTGGYMGCTGCTGGYIVPGTKAMPEPVPPPKSTDKPKEEVRVPTPATIVVELPSDAKLTIDNGATASTSTVRTFVTPELIPAKTFSYTLKAQIVRDGQTLTAEQKITVEAGVETRVNLGMDKFTALTVAGK